MTLGKRIRYFRTLRGLTQKQLGELLGFSEQTAHVRIAQYEINQKIPKPSTLQKIAKALNVSSAALTCPRLDSEARFMQTLFQLEDEYAMSIDKINGEICIRLNADNEMYHTVLKLMKDWYIHYEKYRKGEISKEEYDQWRYTPKTDRM